MKVLDILKTNIIKCKGYIICRNFRDKNNYFKSVGVHMGEHLCLFRCKSKVTVNNEKEYYACEDYLNESTGYIKINQ